METIPKIEIEEEPEVIEEDTTVIEENTPVVDDKAKDDSGSLSDGTVVRLTPTGKISHAKTRVYTQRYRKEWETMMDFKDWLSAVPFQATRAFCNFCQRNLHAHRLSLLKHMCTLKHQRAAAQFSRRQAELNGEQVEEVSNDANYSYERVDTEEDYDEDVSYDENYVQEDEEEEIIENEDQEEVIAESEEDTFTPETKKIKIQANDLLEEANSSMNHTAKPLVTFSDARSNGKKVFFLSNGKSYTLVKSSNLPQLLLNQSGDKNYTFITKPTASMMNTEEDNLNQSRNPAAESITPSSSSQEPPNKSVPSIPSFSPAAPATKSVLMKKPAVSTHVIETSKGGKVSGLQVSLYKLEKGRWTFVHESTTNATGDCTDLSNTNKNILTTGRYKLHYDVEKYYSSKKTATVYPFIEIVFDIKDPGGSYHIPLLLSPFSYSTYKDTPR